MPKLNKFSLYLAKADVKTFEEVLTANMSHLRLGLLLPLNGTIEPTTSPVCKRKNYARFRQLFSVLISGKFSRGRRYWPISMSLAPFEIASDPF
jgi:hypothetical protein